MNQIRSNDDAADRPPRANLRTLLANYRACPTDSRSRSFLVFVRERNPHVLSHHDHQRADYLDHVWRIGGVYLCRGCTTVIALTPLAFVVAIVTRWPVKVPTLGTAAIFSALLLLSVIPLREGPRTLLHDVRRIALGCLLGSAIAYVLLCDDWLLRGVVVGVCLAVLAARRVVALRRSRLRRR